ncbi:MAG: hypothetical protein ACXWWQ_01980 [Candidatus Limnocylindria bacterium]
MTARTPVVRASSGPRAQGSATVGLLCFLLLLEAAFALVMTIFLSLWAGEQGGGAETSTRFAAGGTFIFAIASYVAYRGARRHRSWAWTLSAVLQLVLAIGAGIAMVTAGEDGVTPAYLIAFALAAATMLLLSTSGVRRALGQS